VSDSLFDLAAAAKFEDATFMRGRFFSALPLDPPPAMMQGDVNNRGDRQKALAGKERHLWEPAASYTV